MYSRPEIEIISKIDKLHSVKSIIHQYLDDLTCEKYLNYLSYSNNEIKSKDIIEYISKIKSLNDIYIEIDKKWTMERLNGIDARFTLFKLGKLEKKYYGIF